MGWIVYYALLLVAFVVASGFSIWSGSHIPSWVQFMSGAVTLLSALGQALAKVNLRFYLFGQRIWLWWNSDATALWTFGLRMDGKFGMDCLLKLELFFREEMSSWSPQVLAKIPGELRIKMDSTLHLRISYDPGDGFGTEHLLFRSDELEVPYGRARAKIDSCITPLMSLLINKLHPHHFSTMVDVTFQNRNPFFAFYVSHLRPEQVSQFNLMFTPTDTSRSAKGKVIVTQSSLAITTASTESFGELSKAYLLLTTGAAALAGS